LEDTGFPAFPVLHSEKALYRAGQALYRLRRFDESKEVFVKLMKEFPQNEDGAVYLRKLEERLRETKGIYDFKDIYEELENTRPPHLDRATYIGPVAKRKTADKGNGLFTTRDVKAGELLLCEKAFTHCYSSHEQNPKETGITKPSALFNRFVETSAVTTPDTVIPHVVSAVIQKLVRNPAMLKEVLSLHHGSYKPNKDVLEVDGSPVIDT
jgi:tetratricopeptide (TPR) repeat protein